MSKNREMADFIKTLPFPKPGDDVVISGIAGRFPSSDTLTQLQENLFNKVDIIADVDSCWKSDDPEVPRRTGRINHVHKFDSQFFGVGSVAAHTMDPMGRMLLEHAYEAIIDAGINPEELRGTRTGVFIGSCYCESESNWLYQTDQVGGLGIPGCGRFMRANRISHWLGIKGPSYSVDTACSSSMFALDHAYRAIRSGECDAALVGGANLCLHPNVSKQFYLLGVLSSDGACKSFDDDGNGYCRSEAVSVIYLQKSKDAKRIYAQVVHTKTNCDGYKEEGITFPSGELQGALLQQFYEECKVAPSSLAYIEAHGTGTKVGDPVEVNTLERIFCPGRTTPLRIGSIKSNMGHTEPASGLCSIAKVLISMESGYIPPNLHYNRPREGIKALEDGRIQVITELTPWEGGYVGINSFGFGGANAHVLLKSNPKEKLNNGAPTDNMPRLVVVSGRTENAVTTLLDYLESRPVDVEFVRLLHDIHAKDIKGHTHRGYTILPARGLPVNIIRDVKRYWEAKRPVWFVFSGIEAQWTGIGEGLLKVPVFYKAIRKCNATLKPYGLDIVTILTNKDTKISDNILNSFVCLAAVQIGLVDLLTSIGIVSDNVIGQSVGELGCAYADGCLTAEQIILVAYFQGLALTEFDTIGEITATVGISSEELEGLCPPDIEIARDNGLGRSIISGPVDPMKKFVAQLRGTDVIVTKGPYSGTAYRTSLIVKSVLKLLARLRKVIPNPKPRSQKWLSTSVLRTEWKSSQARLCSPEYYANNLLSPVLYEETSGLIPSNAITIEIVPHGLLKGISRRSLHKNVINNASTKCGDENEITVLLQTIGMMFQAGLYPKLTSLYPAVSCPISRGTPMISPLVRWEHAAEWCMATLKAQDKIDASERVVEINIGDEQFEWMSGHVIDGRNLLPATGYLKLIWESVAIMQGELFADISVVFEDVKFHRATTIPKLGTVTLTLIVQKGSGRFEVVEGGTAVVTGFIRAVSNPAQECVRTEMLIDNHDEPDMTSKDIYKEFRLRGYHYTGLFRGLRGASSKGTMGRIAWDRNWVAFMDNMLQMRLLGIDSRGLFVPTGIGKLVINTKAHTKQICAMHDDNKEFIVQVHKDLDIIVSGGIEIRGLKVNSIGRKKPIGDPVLENFKFVTHRDGAEIGLEEVTRIATQIALENHLGIRIKSIEWISETDDITPENLTSPLIQNFLNDLPLLRANTIIIAPKAKYSDNALPSTVEVVEPKILNTESDALLVVSHGLLASKNSEILKQLRKATKDGGFLLAREPLNADSDVFATIKNEGLDVVMEKRTHTELILLLRQQKKRSEITTVIQVNNNEFTWVPTLQAALKLKNESKDSSRILLISEGDNDSGLMGLVNCLRREPGGEFIHGLLIQDLQAPKFSLENPLYSKQLGLGLAMNVLRPGNVWGSHRFFKMDPLPLMPAHHIRVSQLTRGDLSTMQWVESIIRPSPQQNIIRVFYSSLNFRDVMISTGKLSVDVVAKTRLAQDNVIGLEYSGRDAKDRAVMGIIHTGAFSNLCVCDEEFQWPVPNNWTLEDAATVPVVYSTAYYALMIKGRMKKGDKVLIHAGSGGVGQAAITLALYEGCEVFTTVGTPEKRIFIKNKFPQINDDHIGNSRDTSFEQLILRKTRGQGVDIVLNSLAEEKLQASVRCLTKGGRFLEIGKFDLAANNTLGMEAFLKGITFYGVLLDNLFATSSVVKTELATLFAEGVKSGAVEPLSRTVFPMDQVEAAFRYMAAGKHVGKVLIKICDEDEVSQSCLPVALPRYYCSEDCSYLILGGLGGFGLELADWLVLRGAKKLVLTSRRGISTGYQRMRIDTWKSYGVQVVVVVGKDPSTYEGCESILKEAIALGPVDAIFNLAVVLKDALYENQTVEHFEESFRVKAWATKQLDELSRTLCPHLRQFVVFSSVSCGRGNAGQTNYGMANSVMERICERRVAENLPGLAVQWGAVGDVGLVAEMQDDHKEVVIAGTLLQGISSCLQELEGFLLQKSPVVSSMVVCEKTAGGSGAANIVDAVLNIMGLKDLTSISLSTPLPDLGLDSMMAVEIKQTLEREFEVLLTAQDIRCLNFAKLQEMSAHQTEENDNSGIDATNDSEDLIGLKMFIQKLGINSFDGNTCVPLAARADDGQTNVFVLPGIDGSHTVFQSFSAKLKFPTTCLQFGTTLSNLTSIEDIADSLIPHVKAISNVNSDFVIAGYSFGSLVAIELVRRLESEGRSGRLVLIDGSPEHLRALIHEQITANTDDHLETAFLSGMMNLIYPDIGTQLDSVLDNYQTWEEKLAAFTKYVPEDKNLNITSEDQQAICTSLYRRLRAVLIYNASAVSLLKSPITLLRPTIHSARSISEDYGLRSLTQGKVEVHFVKGNHLTILDNDICAAAINGELIKDVAECHA